VNSIFVTRASCTAWTRGAEPPVKRISSEAYQARHEAPAVIVWNKRAFESYLKAALRASPNS
jgi:hypothetical protein